MTILLLGGWGQVGSAFQREASKAGTRFAAPRQAVVDITRPDQIAGSLEQLCPDVVINLAAHTAVDAAEREPDVAFAANRDGPRNLAKACRRTNTPLVHISTDYVFDGTKRGPYSETDTVNPINVYGKSKLEGENAVRNRLDLHFILRTSWVFGLDGNNFPKTILRLATEKRELAVVDDQHGCPTPAEGIASALLHLVAQIRSRRESFPWGTFHFAGMPPTSWFHFAKHIVEDANFRDFQARRPAIRPVPTREFPTPAPRPAMSILDCSKWRATFDHPLPDWRDGVGSLISTVAGKAGVDCV